MAYSTSNPPKLIAAGIGGLGNLWHYSSADAMATVDGSGYISDAKYLGMKVNDSVLVVDTANGITSFHRVAAINSTTGAGDLGNGTTVGTATNSD